MERVATCLCGQLELRCTAEPLRVAVCHCLACQKQTGSTHNVAGFFDRSDVSISGESQQYTRRSQAGHAVTHHFCPRCGSTVWWGSTSAQDLIAVAVGAFGDSSFPSPKHEVWTEHRHPWIAVELTGST